MQSKLLLCVEKLLEQLAPLSHGTLHHLRPLHSALHRRKIHASQHIQLGQP
uniref:Uncharacterized protein n=1 Tax=Rhizophora mucronata TaxID=61149 RepID=A0A2P2IIK5_RHIMU